MSQQKKIKAIRGMKDLLPEDSPVWQYLEKQVAELAESYGYREIRFPIPEQTSLFKRSIGEVTDIVEKEMYTFDDRNGDSMTLRPEGTAGCVRACEENGLLYNQTQRLRYMGPMFRYERPQKGRLRQFHQIGLECFGMAGPDIDAELILLTARLWQRLGIADSVSLQLNSIGSAEDRYRYKADLKTYLSGHKGQLDVDSQRRLESNPLRILDSKDQTTQNILVDAPSLLDYLGEESRTHFDGLCEILTEVGLTPEINPKLVRGLDYYGKTVFEWVTDRLGQQGAVCAGGRYDGLVEQLGGRSTPAVGFAMGLERLTLLLSACDAIPEYLQPQPDAYVVILGSVSHQSKAVALVEKLRNNAENLHLICHAGGGSIKSQMKKADKSNARFALILVQDELENGQATIKPLRERTGQQSLPFDLLLKKLQADKV